MAAVSKGQVIASYNFGANAAGFTTSATTVAANATALDLEATNNFGSLDAFTTDEGVGGTSGWYTNNSGGNYLSVSSTGSSTDNGYWVQVNVTAAAGFLLDPTSFILDGGAGGSSAVRSAYIFDSVGGFPTNLLTNSDSGPTITGGTLDGSGTFTTVRGTGGAMNAITATFPSTDTNLSSFTVRAYFDTEGNPSKNIDLGLLQLNGSVVPVGPVLQSTWNTNGSGDYNNSSNWTAGVPTNSVGAEADFLGAITSNNVVYTNTPITLGKIVFDNTSSYTLTGAVGANLTLQGTSSALVDVQAGTQEINLPLVLASNTTFQTDSSTASLVIANPLTINSGVALTTTGSGKVIYNSIINVGSNASIAFGNSTYANTLAIAATGSATITGTGTVLEVDSLSNAGQINLQTHVIDINYGSGQDPIASIAAMIQSGYAGGSWTGTGIMSTTAQANSKSYGIGYADSADPGNPAGLASGTIEVMYTLLGDANLDGKVNGTDFNLMATNFNQAVTNGWDKGDFNYDGKVNGNDFVLLAANFNQFASQSGVAPADAAALDSFAAANGISLTNVPEPVSAAIVLIAGLSLLRRTRNDSKQTFTQTF
jgi:hypothetical protein